MYSIVYLHKTHKLLNKIYLGKQVSQTRCFRNSYLNILKMMNNFKYSKSVISRKKGISVYLVGFSILRLHSLGGKTNFPYHHRLDRLRPMFPILGSSLLLTSYLSHHLPYNFISCKMKPSQK